MTETQRKTASFFTESPQLIKQTSAR